jgi:hypothetical protein
MISFPIPFSLCFTVFPVVAGLLIGLWIIMWRTVRAAYVGQFGRRPRHRLLKILLVETKKGGGYTAVPTSGHSNHQPQNSIHMAPS